jgi:hypothetical protein
MMTAQKSLFDWAAEQAQAAYDAAEPVPISEDRVKEVVEYATKPAAALPAKAEPHWGQSCTFSLDWNGQMVEVTWDLKPDPFDTSGILTLHGSILAEVLPGRVDVFKARLYPQQQTGDLQSFVATTLQEMALSAEFASTAPLPAVDWGEACLFTIEWNGEVVDVQWHANRTILTFTSPVLEATSTHVAGVWSMDVGEYAKGVMPIREFALAQFALEMAARAKAKQEKPKRGRKGEKP